ncbi:MAG TPA: FAD-dependent oxidoreductase [Gemmatimonadaceae bacterium]|nr:FAD-dependent oxidoreductase [Gemmatimonadaceae bacterium]
MRTFNVIIVGGGIGGAACALRAAQHGLRLCWIRGDASTAKASRARYVVNVDNMIGIHEGIGKKKLLEALSGPAHAAARAAIESVHFHIGTRDIVDNVEERLFREFPDRVTLIDEKAVLARRDGALFTIATSSGTELTAEAVILATGVMDRQPKVKRTTPNGKVVDEVHWIYPWANAETFLYCILCEGHLTRSAKVVVFGASEAAAQVALMLHERSGASVTLLGNGEPLTASEKTQRLLAAYGIGFRPERVVEVVDGGEKPKGSALGGLRLEDGTLVEARFAMVAMGLHRVYNDLARQLGAELDPRDSLPDDQRHVLVDDVASETSVRGLFAVGDMTRRRGDAPSLKQIYTAQEYAVRAVQAIDRRVRAARREEVLARTGANTDPSRLT